MKMNGLIALEEFLPVRQQIKENKKTLVFTNGCFDILHRGHIDYLNRAKELGDYLVVALNTDESVRRIKGNSRPIVNLQDRAFVMGNLKSVDYVLSFDEPTPFEIISQVIPDILVKGGDWAIDKIIGRDIVENNGGKVIPINFVDNYSTSSIIERILKAYS